MERTDKFWIVKAKGGRKFHLMRFAEEEGTSEVALCGQRIPWDRRSVSARTIAMPKGDECENCLIKSGHLKEKRSKFNKRLRFCEFAKLAFEFQTREAEAKAREAGVVSEGELSQVREEVRKRFSLFGY